jgi:hypothetical protein
MSILTLAYPAQEAAAIVQAFSGSIAATLRPMLGAGILAIIGVFAVVFKPVVIGVLRTAQLVFRPKVPTAQIQLLNRLEGVRMLNQLAKDVDATQPNLAAEMRYLAARG